MEYDSYGNVTSITDAESNTLSLTYSASYSYAYLTEISATVGQDTITTKATYDSYRGWITSIQEPKGVDAESGYDYLYTYDLLGRITKKEFPLLSGQAQRSYLEAVYDDTNRTITIIDQLKHYLPEFTPGFMTTDGAPYRCPPVLSLRGQSALYSSQYGYLSVQQCIWSRAVPVPLWD
jgi:hypothetical protein